MDIVQRLRDRAGKYDEENWHGDIELEAANEIERLRDFLEAVTYGELEMDKCKEAFEKCFHSTVCEDMDIQTEVDWENWRDAWNAAIQHAASVCDRLAIDGKGIRGPTDRAFTIARDNVLKLQRPSFEPPT